MPGGRREFLELHEAFAKSSHLSRFAADSRGIGRRSSRNGIYLKRSRSASLQGSDFSFSTMSATRLYAEGNSLFTGLIWGKGESIACSSMTQNSKYVTRVKL
ncbi:hypothetical protein TNIN_85591 [Trichonephila inaurata madagascariensis]|uniref:Uncharacterized protein n=1 Tax=Trichonephila inaurata madagascariensis TaxID=2747483 RepID=A0A8X7C743_9ARAC|nr:hypothetical protein TNIN_85591 [Trichonephila inaurata madagascariensis]